MVCQKHGHSHAHRAHREIDKHCPLDSIHPPAPSLVTPCHPPRHPLSPLVTPCHPSSPLVTPGHPFSPRVTPCHPSGVRKDSTFCVWLLVEALVFQGYRDIEHLAF